jgi:hypothetical protein
MYFICTIITLSAGVIGHFFIPDTVQQSNIWVVNDHDDVIAREHLEKHGPYYQGQY